MLKYRLSKRGDFMNINDKINFALRVLQVYDFNMFYKLYPFSTENLKGCFDNFDFKNKSVLTVGSSCDQIFNLLLRGASSITCFDINPLTDVNFYLKYHAIKNFSYDEFVNFYSFYVNSSWLRNKNVFNQKGFDKIFASTNLEEMYFWKFLLSKYSGRKLRKGLFSNDEYPFSKLSKFNDYLSLQGFYKLKGILSSLNPSFIISDIRNVSESLNRKFDYVILSNIASYIGQMYDNSLEGFKNDVLKLSDFLLDDGLILLAYLYDMTPTTIPGKNWDAIYDFKRVSSSFGYNHLFYSSFESIKLPGNKNTDMILVYKK
jgi:hypothetical protein